MGHPVSSMDNNLCMSACENQEEGPEEEGKGGEVEGQEAGCCALWRTWASSCTSRCRNTPSSSAGSPGTGRASIKVITSFIICTTTEISQKTYKEAYLEARFRRLCKGQRNRVSFLRKE